MLSMMSSAHQCFVYYISQSWLDLHTPIKVMVGLCSIEIGFTIYVKQNHF